MWTNDEDMYVNSITRPTNKKEGKNMSENQGNTVEVEIVDETVEVRENGTPIEAEFVEDTGTKVENLDRILAIKQEFTTLQDEAFEQSSLLAEKIGMLELDETGEFVTNSVMQLQELAMGNKKIDSGLWGKTKGTLLALPGVKTLAGAVGAIKDEAEKQSITNGSVRDLAEKLFGSLESKKDTIESTTISIMTIEEAREINLVEMNKMLGAVNEIIDSPDTSPKELFQAKNMLIQVEEAIMQSQTKVDQVSTILEVAQASTYQITSLLPSIKSNFLDDMAINAGLQHLLQYKSMYDATVNLVNDIQETNADKINETMLDVVDITISVAQTDRLTRIGQKRIDGHKKLVELTTKQFKKQDESIQALAGIKKELNQLGSRQAAALISTTSASHEDTKNGGKTGAGDA